MTAVRAAARVVSLELAMPYPELSPNWRGPRQRRWQAAQQYRDEIAVQVYQQLGPPPRTPLRRRALLEIEAYYGRGVTMWDADNLLAAFKAGLDQLVRSGLLRNDSPRWLELGGVQSRRVLDGARSYLLVTLRETEDE